VAFGRPALDPSGGSVMRAVSFFGAADCGIDSPPAGRLAGAGVGFNGTVGRAPSEGGLGGGLIPLTGLWGGSGAPPCEGGLGGAGTNGFGAEGGAWGTGPASDAPGIFVVSFFGTIAGRGTAPVGAGFPGRLIRTVSRFKVGCSGLDGSVMRIVSALEASSADSEGAGGISFSSDIRDERRLNLFLTLVRRCQSDCLFRRDF
jgi:hypothetical protein